MKNTTNDEVSIEKIFDAPVENVWKAWTEPSLTLKWFGSDPNGKGLSAGFDVRPGGTFELTFSDSDGSGHTCYGVYANVKPPTKLTFTWAWKSEPGVESFVTIMLFPEGNKTRMQFKHSGLGTASQHDYLYGWNGAFAKLEQCLKMSI